MKIGCYFKRVESHEISYSLKTLGQEESLNVIHKLEGFAQKRTDIPREGKTRLPREKRKRNARQFKLQLSGQNN